MPTRNPYSEEFKDNAINVALQSISGEAVGKKQEENDNMGFFQARNLDDFLKIGFERKRLQMGNFEFNDVEVGCFGSKMLLAGDDQTVNNFLQEYVSVLLKLESVKNLTLRKNTQVYLVPSG